VGGLVVAADALCMEFQRHYAMANTELEVMDDKTILPVFSATMSQFCALHSEWSLSDPNVQAYSLNPLFRLPILRAQGQLICPYPELILNAAGRGLLFKLADDLGQTFTAQFGKECYEKYVGTLLDKTCGRVFCEADDRKAGYTGKTSDWTLILDNSILLFECKLSLLYLPAKQFASEEYAAASVRAVAANSEEKSGGVFQLAEKVQVLKHPQQSTTLRDLYRCKNPSEILPVLLVYDPVRYANSPLGLRVLIDQELKRADIQDFEYQIWHVEELEQLLSLIPAERFIETVREKFTHAKYRSWDLSAYLWHKTQNSELATHNIVPQGLLQRHEVLRELLKAK